MFYTKRKRAGGQLKEKIQNGEFPSGSRLPTIRKIASLFEISLRTANLVLRDLEKQGLIETRIRQGAYVRAGASPRRIGKEPALAPAKSRTEEIVDNLAEQISHGDLKTGEYLPLRKTLKFRFGASSVTINRVLDLAEKRRLILRKGTRYVAGSGPVSDFGTRQRVYTIPAWSIRNKRGYHEHVVRKNFIPEFEKELSRHGISFVGPRGRENVKRKGIAVPTGSNACGYFYHWSLSIVNGLVDGSESRLEKEFSRVNSMGIPFVFFNCATIHNAFPRFSLLPYRNIFALGADNRMAGEQTASYLEILGHRKIAYFTLRAEEWADQRMEGLVRGIQGAPGGSGEVRHFRASLSDRKFNPFHNLTGPEILRNVAEFTKRISAGRQFHSHRAARQLAAHAFTQLNIDWLQARLEPLFEEALGHEDITAWATSDSTLGLPALRFLQAKGVNAPGKISLIALDDDQVLSEHAITGCDFQADRMGYLAAHCILGDIPVRRSRLGVVECPPRIVERGTVARV